MYLSLNTFQYFLRFWWKGDQELPLSFSWLQITIPHRDLVAYEQSCGVEEEDEVEADGANYQLEMMRCLREVNVDNNNVGWYDCLSRAGIKNVFIHIITDNVSFLWS